MTSFVVRPAELRDLESVGKLAGQLVRMHHDVDPGRFLLVEGVEEGYVKWLSREIARADRGCAVILVATHGDAIVGYAYGTLEGRDWNMLLDAHCALHDVFVAASARRSGVGRALVEGMLAAFDGLGTSRVVLSTMVGNESAQRMFRACGFRPTMLEMTRS